jgi:DNA mismatch repair ATPase MutL
MAAPRSMRQQQLLQQRNVNAALRQQNIQALNQRRNQVRQQQLRQAQQLAQHQLQQRTQAQNALTQANRQQAQRQQQAQAQQQRTQQQQQANAQRQQQMQQANQQANAQRQANQQAANQQANAQLQKQQQQAQQRQKLISTLGKQVLLPLKLFKGAFKLKSGGGGGFKLRRGNRRGFLGQRGGRRGFRLLPQTRPGRGFGRGGLTGLFRGPGGRRGGTPRFSRGKPFTSATARAARLKGLAKQRSAFKRSGGGTKLSKAGAAALRGKRVVGRKKPVRAAASAKQKLQRTRRAAAGTRAERRNDKGKALRKSTGFAGFTLRSGG